MPSASDVLSRCKKLESDGEARQLKLRRIEEAYGGDYQERRRKGYWRKLMRGGEFPAWYEDEKSQKLHIVVNLLRPMAEAKRGLIGKLPDERVPPPGTDIAAQLLADQNELILRAAWRESHMKRNYGDLGFYLPIHGSAVHGLDINFRTGRPEFVVRSARGAYAVPKDTRGIELKELVFACEYNSRDAAAMFDAPWLDENYTDTTVKIYEYWSAGWHLYITDRDDSKFIIENENIFGKIPFVIIPNIAVPGSLWGDSDIEQGIELVKEYNRRYSIETEAIIRTLFAPWVIRNPLKVPKEISLDPYSIIPVGEGGDVHPAQPAQIPYQWMQGKTELQGLIRNVTGTPSALMSDMDSSIVTAKAFNASLAPINSQVEIRNQYIYDGNEWLNSLYLEYLYTKEHSTKHHMRAFTADGSPFSLEFEGAEIEGYYENEVFLPGSTFVDEQTEFMQIQAERNDGRISKRTAMRYSKRVPNVEQELALVAQERLDDARLQAIIQVEAQKILAQAQSQQPPQGGAPQLGPGPTPGPAAAEQDMYAQERGANPSGPFTASPAPATGTGGEPMPPGMAPPAGLPPVPGPSDTMMSPPVGAVARAAVDEFRDIAKIPHGHKILVGGPVITDDRLGPDSVEIFLTDMNDKATIVNHITNTAPELHGCMDFFEGDPVGPYIDATPGSAGYDVQGKPGEQPLSGEMIPPEMAGMAGAGPEGAPAAPPMMQGA